MKKKKKQIITVLFAVLLSSLVGCGTSTNETMAPVAEENTTVAPTATEEPTKEEQIDPNATYVEVNNLKYEENTEVTTNGVLYVGNNIETLDVINVNWKLTNVVMGDVEDGTKQLTVEQSVEGHIWTDGNIFATNLNVPVARLADAYTGQMIAVGDEDAVETELKWKDNTYTISAVETTSWEDGNWDTDWVEDPNGGEKLSSTLIVKTVISIDEDYDGLVLVLTPIVDANGSVDGALIMDGWTNDSHLFNVNDMSANFVAIADAGEVEESGTDEATEDAESAEEEVKAESKTEEAKSVTTTATTTPKEEHKHSYTSTDSPSSCTVAGIRTYTCSGCGDSYTENLGYGSHDYSIPIYSTVHHEAQYQTVKRELPSEKYISCRECDGRFDSYSDWENHILVDGTCSMFAAYDAVTVSGGVTYDYIEISPAYDSEEIVAYKCSICGQQR